MAALVRSGLRLVFFEGAARDCFAPPAPLLLANSRSLLRPGAGRTLLLHRATGKAGGDMALAKKEEDHRRIEASTAVAIDGVPVDLVHADVLIDAESDRHDLLLITGD